MASGSGLPIRLARACEIRDYGIGHAQHAQLERVLEFRIRSSCRISLTNTMLRRLRTRPELAAYAIVITVSVILGVFIGKTYLVGASSNRLNALEGTKFQLAGVDWQKSERTVVLGLRIGCGYCEDSAEFYRALSEQCRLKKVRLIAVAPNLVSESQQYLKELGVTVDEVRQSELPPLGVMRTPTLVLVDNGGVVSRIWLGKLSPANQQDVFTQVAGS